MVGRILWLLFTRALWLRCPVCGRGRLFRSWFKMYENCPNCGYHFEREEGYFTGAMAINLIVTEVIVFVAVILLAVNAAPIVPAILCGVALAIAAPILGYPHSRSFWMALDLVLHPLGT